MLLCMRVWLAAIVSSLVLASCVSKPVAKPAVQVGGKAKPLSAQQVETFVGKEMAKLQPLMVASQRAWFAASVTGTDEAFAASAAADGALNAHLSSPNLFATIQRCRDSGNGAPQARRQLDMLYLLTLGKQVDPAMLAQITALEKEVEQAFNTYRGRIDGREVTNNELLKILRTSTDSAVLKAAWEAQKSVGAVVAPKLRELVRLRNEVARRLGFRDYFALKLAESELDEPKLMALFDELDTLTRAPFLKLKLEVDRRLAARLGIDPAALMPWHYQNPFFQEPPDVFATGLDATYEKQDTLAVCRAFYAGIGIDIDDILARSDLYEKPGKTPHAFEADIDREGDVRVIANVVPGGDWQATMLHELGHAIYDKYADRSLPFLLRGAPHPLTTEGLAMMLDRLVGNPSWAAAMGLIDAEKAAAAAPEARLEQAFGSLLFSRWTQVMLRFEQAMYADPDQDLSELWWTLVERYQAVQRPPQRRAPDYASKVHVVVAPVYYQNYMLGELFSAQVHETIAKLEGKDPAAAVFVGDAKVGEFLKTRLFAPSSAKPWPELVKDLTGTELSPEPFARRFSNL